MNVIANEYVGNGAFNINLLLAGLYQNMVTIGGNSRKAERLLAERHDMERSGVLSSFINIIDRTAERANESMENARGRMNGMGISGFMHDLRNVMTGVVSYSQMAKMIFGRKDYDGLKRTLKSIHSASAVAGQTIKPLLDQKIVQDNILNGFTGENQEFKLIMGKALELSQSRRGKNVDVFDKVPTKSMIIKENGLELLHVLTNIFINAFDAMAENGANPQQKQVLNISAEADEDWIRIRIADTGIGMDPEVQKRVFEKGFSTKGENGQGIGLYSCMEAIEKKLGGTIAVESWLGQGTVFHITIPCE